MVAFELYASGEHGVSETGIDKEKFDHLFCTFHFQDMAYWEKDNVFKLKTVSDTLLNAIRFRLMTGSVLVSLNALSRACAQNNKKKMIKQVTVTSTL